jgi:hypothetical protein
MHDGPGPPGSVWVHSPILSGNRLQSIDRSCRERPGESSSSDDMVCQCHSAHRRSAPISTTCCSRSESRAVTTTCLGGSRRPLAIRTRRGPTCCRRRGRLGLGGVVSMLCEFVLLVDSMAGGIGRRITQLAIGRRRHQRGLRSLRSGVVLCSLIEAFAKQTRCQCD